MTKQIGQYRVLSKLGSGGMGVALTVATERLVRTANENGGYDNISVVLLEAVDAAVPRSRPGATREYQAP